MNFLLRFIEDSKRIAHLLHTYGFLFIKDPRIIQKENNNFLDIIEKYYKDRSQRYYKGETVPEIFPSYKFQTGATHEFQIKSRNHSDISSQFNDKNLSQTHQPPPYDAKWRYFWQVPDQKDQKFELPRIVPHDFPQWEQQMDIWGKMMLDGCYAVAEMAALGFGVQEDAFTNFLKGGNHFLSPLGSDLERYKVGTIFTGFHYDLNFLTIHGKCRYPGLFVWTRSGERFEVLVPEGYFLIQAGKQFEIVTGGYVNCGFHEVVYTQDAYNRMVQNKKENQSTWRVSSVMFATANYNSILQPIDKFLNDKTKVKYKPILAYDQVQEELDTIFCKK